MPIKARCSGCGANFQAKDSLAGKRVKCPKCAQPMIINQPGAASGKAAPRSNKPTGVGGAYNPLLDLLDEGNVKSAVRGQTCPNCSAEMRTGAIICVDCGFNIETGERLRTASYQDDDDDDSVKDVGKTSAESIMAKAERAIDDMPIGSDGQDFGDGADSFMIAAVAGVILVVLVGICLGVILSMEVITQSIASWFISFLASLFMGGSMIIWITIVAFKQKPGHGIACLCTGGLWCVVFGFLQGKELLLPTLILLFSFIIGAATGTYTMYNGITPSTGAN